MSLAVPATQTGLTHVPVTVFGWCITAKGEHPPGSLWEVSPEPAGNQAEWRGDPSCGNVRTPDSDTLPELAEKQKFWFWGEEGEKSMIGNFVASKLGVQKSWAFLAAQKVRMI